MTEFESKSQSFTGEFSTLWALLSKAAADPNCGNAVCIIDALDEYEEASRAKLMRSLAMLHSKRDNRNRNKTFLKFHSYQPSIPLNRKGFS